MSNESTAKPTDIHVTDEPTAVAAKVKATDGEATTNGDIHVTDEPVTAQDIHVTDETA
ncbi:hypothetical protein ABZ896_19805 [Streptomyces sp. NPDC047072]|uniref:hypothetical protein n=1 Tax=Streptomyces sp. NPDC047072 TaxID=3154809 RepID=UPI0033D5185E